MRLRSADDVISHLRDDVYVRLSASEISGVGVFALRQIPRGIDPFQEEKLGLSFLKIRASKIMDDERIPTSIKKYVHDMCSCRDGLLNIPAFGFNGIMPLYYLNHSLRPNMEVEPRTGYFRSLRRIREGEELTVNYSTYNDDVGIETYVLEFA